MSELRIRPMTQAEFEPYCRETLRDYGAEQVRVGEWRPEEADALARREGEVLLPHGLKTPGMALMTAESADGDVVGFAWLALRPVGRRGAWLYDITIRAEHRGRGYGRGLLAAVEAEARRRGAESLGLNVFGANRVARSLYESAGYAVSALQMRKPLTSPE